MKAIRIFFVLLLFTIQIPIATATGLGTVPISFGAVANAGLIVSETNPPKVVHPGGDMSGTWYSREFLAELLDEQGNLIINGVKYAFPDLYNANNALISKRWDFTTATIPLNNVYLGGISILANTTGEGLSAAKPTHSIAYSITYTDGGIEKGTIDVAGDFGMLSGQQHVIKMRSMQISVSDWSQSPYPVDSVAVLPDDTGSGYVFQYEIPVGNPLKTVESITFGDDDSYVLRVFAISGILPDAAQMETIMPQLIDRLPALEALTFGDLAKIQYARQAVEYAKSIGVSSQALVGSEILEQMEKAFVSIDNCVVNTNLISIDLQINFAGAIRPSDTSYSNFKVTYDGKILSDKKYKIVSQNKNDGVESVTLVIFHGKNYGQYQLTVSQAVTSNGAYGLSLPEDYIFDFTATAPFEIDSFVLKRQNGMVITDILAEKGNTIRADVVIKNNSVTAGQPYAITVAVFGENTEMYTSKTVLGTLDMEQQETLQINIQIPSEMDENFDVACFAVDSFKQLNVLHKTLFFLGDMD